MDETWKQTWKHGEQGILIMVEVANEGKRKERKMQAGFGSRHGAVGKHMLRPMAVG